MAVKLNVHANVTGQQQLAKLNIGLKSLGTQALIAKRKLAALEAGAARSRATMAGLGTALKVGVVAGFAVAGFAAASFVKGTIEAGNLVEKSRIQFNAFFGDVKQGGEAFQILNDYASTVPFTLDKIISGGTALAAISDGPLELGKNLELVGNLAATANISFQDAALQYQRVASAGVAAADLLRDKGVSGLLGFTAGAKYSVDESVKIFEEAFLDGGKFSKVANDLAGTLSGNVSMVEDFYFKIKAAAAQPLFEGLSQQVKELVGDFKKNDAQLKALGVRIGKSLASGFKKLGEFIRFLVENFENLVTIIKIFIGLKVIGFVGNFASQIALLATNMKLAGGAAMGLNVALRANPIGLIVTAVQGLTLAIFYFKDEIMAVGSYLKDIFTPALNRLRVGIKQFGTDADETNLDVFEQDLEKIREEVEGLTASYVGLTKAQKDAFAGRLKDPSRGTQRKTTLGEKQAFGGKLEDPSKVLADEKAAKLKDFLAEQSRNKKIEFDKIVREAEKKHESERLAQVKTYREALAGVGIESQGVADTISTTWIDGLRQGNSLLEITKNSFKNVLKSIAETLLKKSIEYGVELLFQALLGDKISKEKAITKEKNKQLAATAAMAVLNIATGGTAGAVSNGVKFFGMNKGGVVPGGAPYTDRIPTMLTPGEVVIPRGKANNGSTGNSTNVTNINISGNVDQRSIDQIKAVISSSSSEVGGANKSYQSNTQGVRGRNK